MAGGSAAKLYPLTFATNKHLLPVFDFPMIYYPIQTLIRCGVSDILVVTGGPNASDIVKVLGNGKNFGVRHMEYAYQEKLDGGIADALSLAEGFSDGGPITVILGDNTTDMDFTPFISSFKDGAMIFLKKVADPERFGVPVFSRPKKGQKSKILKIEEKPKEPVSEYAVTGLYIYDNDVFNIIRNIKPSERGQLEITDVNNEYIQRGKLEWIEFDSFWTDAGTPSSLLKANVYWAMKKGVNLL